jgi:hypothetical protein
MTRKKYFQTFNVIKGFTTDKLPPSKLKGMPINGVIIPEHKEQRKRYKRQSNIDYSALDNIGHGPVVS